MQHHGFQSFGSIPGRWKRERDHNSSWHWAVLILVWLERGRNLMMAQVAERSFRKHATSWFAELWIYPWPMKKGAWSPLWLKCPGILPLRPLACCFSSVWWNDYERNWVGKNQRLRYSAAFLNRFQRFRDLKLSLVETSPLKSGYQIPATK